MGVVVPDTYELEVLTSTVVQALTMKLFSNDYTPSGSSTIAAFTEVVGGGYGQKSLLGANWGLASGDPTQGTYNATQVWTFTGPTNAPGNIYGYYVVRNSDNKLMWAERFPAGSLPFVPVAGSIVRILPRYSVQSQF